MLDSCENVMGTPPPSMLNNSSIRGPKSSISPLFSSPSRLWRPEAQRNVRNQWSKLLSSKNQWESAALEGRLHATELVNAFLNRRYLPEMNLGALKEIQGIREKACKKLAHKQDLCRSKLLSSYKDMVIAVNNLGKASCSMRCYLKGSASNQILKYSDHQEDPNDSGDGGGVPVFFSLSMSTLEDLARELVNYFMRELSLKRFLVIALLSIESTEGGEEDVLDWADELYDGEFDDLRSIGMLKQHNCHLAPPQIKDYQSSDPLNKITIKSSNHNSLEVFLTTWISDANIDVHRVKKIFSIVEEEMHAKLL
ncbi:uncharacterized protein LOC110019562 [Phalaenopsis equestris]|uniref:uncharacterized protein LOC110019562 n=1 Tax=Phalaenopsis equestris TaxID=78828 RepID=UPI0009E3A24D|nr:uncharacterized protein LOC110019562 [Phalaenopsis equestris]XP_020572936.1 uncharacterized protein LOC110019562 [Phalaenopsis equestris]XP_020572937.1 uncharacterized protein LOC110019562 [Phalaenopsis equestris]